MARPYFDMTIPQLERLVADHREKPAVLGQVWEELTYRDTDRSRQLMREVLGLLNGVVPQPPPPLQADGPEKQIDLL